MSEFDELNLREPFLKGLRNLVSGNQAKSEDLVEFRTKFLILKRRRPWRGNFKANGKITGYEQEVKFSHLV